MERGWDRADLSATPSVKWHDGTPFTAEDVKCTWDLVLEKSSEKLRVNPRKSFYRNLDRVTTNGYYEVTFYLKRPQPAFLMILATGSQAIYPCAAADSMRRTTAPGREIITK